MKKHIYPFLIAILAACPCCAQKLTSSTFGSSGTTANVGGRYYSHVVGQMSISGTSMKNGIVLRQGFKQPQMQGMATALNKTMPYPNLVSQPTEDNPVNFTAFPNPFVDKLTIGFSDYSANLTELIIYDLLGNVVFQKMYPSLTKEILLTDFKDFRAGKYIIKMLQNGKPSTLSVIKSSL